MSTSRIAIVGAGPAGLMAAEMLSSQSASVTIYERMPSAARKFLLAGRGGLNLTHSENLQSFLTRYGNAAPRLRAALEAFPPDAVRAWCEGLGQPTFVGTSGRVFPKAFKTSPLLRTWLRRLDTAGVAFALRHQWTGWTDAGDLCFETPQGPITAKADAVILALGGASWPRLGSDGAWTAVLQNSGIECAQLRPANCGFVADWSELFRARFAGQPLKRIALSFAGRTIRGEAVITRDGIEGGGIYALSSYLRDAIARDGAALLSAALRPDLSQAGLQSALAAHRGKQSMSNVLRKSLKLSPQAIGLLQEAAVRSNVKLGSMTAAALAELINAVPIRLTASAPLARAISTAGGVSFNELDDKFMIKRRPGVFAAGEMLDWEAPTGGYLLQASFATGAAAARGAMLWLRDNMALSRA